jgi:trk system potassium uptake protein TrkH
MGRRLAYVIGVVVAGSSLVMLPAAVVALLFREWTVALQIGGAALVTAACGAASWRFLGRPGQLSTKEGFAVVALAWFAVTAFGTLPYLFTGSLTGPTDAFFETAAGFTTTGATVFTDLADPPRGILFWRALTQWMGGMGFVVLSIAVLPLLGSGGVQLARAESPGPEPDRLTPRFRETARRLWLIYAGITAAAFVLLAFGDMDLFEAAAHALAAVSTGGFGTDPGSVAVFSPYTQWVIVAVMLAAGTSFALHYRAVRDPAGYLRHPEFRLYVAFILGAAVLIGIGTWTAGGAADTIRKAVFSATALVTGTGFVVDDFGRWPETLQILAVGLMFIGGMAGSTAGAFKVFRVGVLVKSASGTLQRIVYPNAVSITRFGRDPVPDHIVRSVQSFFLFYVLALVVGTFLLAALEAGLSSGIDLVTATSAVVSALGNIGPGLGEVGPSGTYAGVSAGGKWLLSFLMVLGRLEIFPVLLLFTRWLWRR